MLGATAGGEPMREITPVTGACIWHGSDMAKSPRWRCRLTPAQLAEIDAALAAARARGHAWEETTAADFPLPSCAALADDIRAELEDGGGIVLLRGLDPARYSLPDLKLIYAGL